MFCDIIRGEVPGYVVFEDDVSAALLDRRPLFPGHCLLVPREHHETLTDLPAGRLEAFFGSVQFLTRTVEQAMEADGSFVAVNNRVSQSVPHLHVHVVPRRRKDGLRGFFWPRNPYRDEAHARQTLQRLRDAVAALRTSCTAP